jgi:anti-sigma28 factor (negative regulator of flagellin synthesis)
MDVNRIPSSRDLARLRYEQTRQEVSSESQERVRGAREALERLSEFRAERLRRGRELAQSATTRAAQEVASDHTDSVQISDRARIMAGEHAAPTPDHEDEARAERVAELKARFERGELNTLESTERAAAHLLRGDR